MICVMGLGFVGLTTALGFAHYGHKVYGYDIDGEMIEKLKERKLSFLEPEPELDSILLKELDSHFFIAEEEKDAMILSSIIFFCTGTPCGENGEADLSHLLTAIGACIKTRDFIKYLSNTLLATMISFSNEMSEIAEDIGTINIRDAFRILHLDKRWNGCDMKSYVYPGCGYGEYCLPKDTKALYMIAQKRGIDTEILQNVIKVNDNMAVAIVRRVKKIFNC